MLGCDHVCTDWVRLFHDCRQGVLLVPTWSWPIRGLQESIGMSMRIPLGGRYREHRQCLPRRNPYKLSLLLVAHSVYMHMG